jgi:Domain of unknown function (DUF1995)
MLSVSWTVSFVSAIWTNVGLQKPMVSFLSTAQQRQEVSVASKPHKMRTRLSASYHACSGLIALTLLLLLMSLKDWTDERSSRRQHDRHINRASMHVAAFSPYQATSRLSTSPARNALYTADSISRRQASLHHASSSLPSSSLSMIANLFSSNKADKLPSLPRNVKEAVSQCRQATQEALQKQTSRMSIEFPVGTKFGVEKTGKQTSDTKTPTLQDLERSNRELARLFVEMFQPVGGDQIAVLFPTYKLAEDARKAWKDDYTAQARILCMDKGKGSSSKKSKALGFAAKLNKEVDNDTSGPFTLPDNIQVALCVAPGPRELVIIERICSQVGMETLVILLNARLTSLQKWPSPTAQSLFENEFDEVFFLSAANNQTATPNCLLYRAYPGPWIMARKPTGVGPPKSLWSGANRPNATVQLEAYGQLELNEVEKSVEGVIENIASWFR